MKEIPLEYMMPCDAPGTLEQMSVPGLPNATVYLPAGYGETDERYPVFILLHGGGGNQFSFFSVDGILKNMIDHMTEAGEIRRMIIVAPCYYAIGRNNDGVDYAEDAVREFETTLTRKILPLIDEKYRTIPEKRSRGIGGFAMGAVATWYIMMMEGTDYFYWYMPMSGDCWICGRHGGKEHTRQTTSLMATALKGKEFYIHALAGGMDVGYPNLDPQIQAMMNDYPEVFKGKMSYSVLPEGAYDYADIRRYIYNALPDFFRESPTV